MLRKAEGQTNIDKSQVTERDVRTFLCKDYIKLLRCLALPIKLMEQYVDFM